MEKYFGFAKELLERGMAREEGSYEEASRLYDLTIKEHDDIAFYIDLARKTGGRVLDMGCGTGRVLIPLLKEGVEAYGLDSSSSMLRIAEQKMQAAGCRAGLFAADIRDFDLPHRFGLIILPYYTMIYILTDDDRLKVFRTVYRHLEDGGLFAFDFDAGEEAVRESAPWLSLQTMDESGDAALVRIAQMKVVHKNLRLVNQITYRIAKNGDGRVTVCSEAEATVAPDTMRRLLLEAGFEDVRYFADYAGTPYREGAECVVVARKRRE